MVKKGLTVKEEAKKEKEEAKKEKEDSKMDLDRKLIKFVHSNAILWNLDHPKYMDGKSKGLVWDRLDYPGNC